jgi:flagellar basal-body rod protein FlgG
MLEGLYSAAAGMGAQQQRLDLIANDLANASTTGYKHARVGFRDLLYSGNGPGAGTSVISGAGAAASLDGRSMASGSMQDTGEPLDLAIQGDGFFEVKRSDGTIGLTRDGSFGLDASGNLTTKLGDLVQPPIAVPRGTQPKDISVAADGTVTAGTRKLGKLALVTVRSSLPQQRAVRCRPQAAHRSTRASWRHPTWTSAARWST